MDSTVDPNARFITPTGLPLAIVCVSLVLVFSSILTTGLRTCSRLRDAVLGLDDGLAIAGTVRFPQHLLWSNSIPPTAKLICVP